MNPSPIVVALDIGTTKVCAIVGTYNEHRKIDILGFGKAESDGVRRGVVENIEKTVNAIRMAVTEAEKQSGVKINIVYVGIAGEHIRSFQHKGIITLPDTDKEISKEDVVRLYDEMHKLALQPGDQIVHVLPQEYTVDSHNCIKDPIGMTGVRLEGNFHIITGQIAAAKNIYKCVKKAGLDVRDLILEPLASSEAVLSEEEKEAGVALVDIGGGTTDIAIFEDKIIRHTAVIPFGGNIITDDIKAGFSVMRLQAEQLKQRFGSALSDEIMENEIITVPGIRGRDPKEISRKVLAQVIQARMQEVVEFVAAEIKFAGYSDKLFGGMVVTGGGAMAKYTPQLVEYVTGLDTRLGMPNEHLAKGMVQEVKSPMYATGIGLVILGLKKETQPEAEAAKQKEEKEKRKPLTLFDRVKNFVEESMSKNILDE